MRYCHGLACGRSGVGGGTLALCFTLLPLLTATVFLGLPRSAYAQSTDEPIGVALRASQRSARVGEVISFTLVVSHPEPEDGAGNDVSGVVDLELPAPFRLLDDHLSAEHSALVDLPVAADGRAGRVRLGALADPAGQAASGSVALDSISLPVNSRLTVRFQLVVSSDAELGADYHVSAQLVSPDDGEALGASAEVAVRIGPDPIFEQAVVLGKAFCDDEGDGRQSAGESGLMGARVYLDTGYYVDTDDAGRYHFDAVEPGTHLVKIDSATLPPGSELLSPERRLIDVTPGLPSQIDFGVRCSQTWVSGVDLELSEEVARELLEASMEGYYEIDADPAAPSLTVAGRDVELLACDLELETGLADFLVVESGVLHEPLTMHLEAPSAERWEVIVEDPEGRQLWSERGESASATTRWRGLDADGDEGGLSPGAYRVVLEARAGGRWCRAEQGVVAVSDTSAWRFNQTLSADYFGGGGVRATPLLRAALGDLQDALERLSPWPILVAVHHDDSRAADDARRLTERRADAVVDVLVADLALDESRVRAAGYGGEQPLVPNTSEENRQRNRRIVIAVPDPRAAESIDVPAPLPQALLVNGQEVQLDEMGGLSTVLPRPADDIVDIELRDGEGGAYGLRARLPQPPQTGPGDEDTREGGGEADRDGGAGDTPTPHGNPIAPAHETPNAHGNPIAPAPAHESPTAPATRTQNRTVTLFELDAGWPIVRPAHPGGDALVAPPVAAFRVELAQVEPLEPLDATDVPETPPTDSGVEPLEPDRRGEGGEGAGSDQPATGEETASLPPRVREVEREGAVRVRRPEPAEEPADEETRAEVIERVEAVDALETDLRRRFTAEALTERVAAADLRVSLPPAGAVLPRHELMVWGRTRPGNRLRVAGEPVPVGSDGRFRQLVALPSGPSTLLVETEDEDGNRGRLEWPVEVAPVRYFLLALGDGAVGTEGASLPGLTDDNHVTTDSEVAHVFYGQARLYLKAWVSGEDILSGLFEEWSVTAYADSGRREALNAFFDEVIEPDRTYAVYGDTSEQVDDVAARGKLYLMVEADHSRLGWGSLETDLEGLELFQYHRTLEGAQLVIDEVWDGRYDTEIRVHAAPENPVRQAYDYFSGTVGTIYYLRQDELIEGSERVAVVVRDGDSGLEIYRRRLRRNEDYTIRYREGRLRLMSPLPSLAESGFVTARTSTTRNPLSGHRVYLEVSYEHEVDDAGFNALGGHVRERIDDWLSLGAGYVREGRTADADDYQLWGVEAGLRYSDWTRLEVEYVQSQNVDSSSRLSDDGGLTFSRFNPREAGDDAGSTEGAGLYLSGGFQASDFLGDPDRPTFYLGGYFHQIDPGFYAGRTIMDQGHDRFGGEAQVDFPGRSQIRVQHDGGTADVAPEALPGQQGVAEAREVDRQVSRAQYLYTAEGVRFLLEYGHTFYQDSADDESYHTDSVGFGISFDIIDRLTLSIDQEVVARSEDPRVIRVRPDGKELSPGDRFLSGVGLGYRLFDDLAIQATGRARYSGDATVSAGFRSGFDDDVDIYVEDRFETFRDRRGTTNSIVVGGEERWGADGLGRSYAEYQAGGGVGGRRGRALVGVGRRVALLDGLTLDVAYEHTQILDPQFSGETIRDAGSLGWEYLGLDFLKLSSRVELRLDDGNEERPRAEPCDTDGTLSDPSMCRDQLPGGTDRFQLNTFHALELSPVPDLTLFVRHLYSETEDLTFAEVIARGNELSVGVAVRPVDFNWIQALVKYTLLEEMRPVDLFGTADPTEWETTHVLSLVPILNLDVIRLQLVEKIALRRTELRWAGLEPASNDILLWINRVNYHIVDQVDAGLEYRLLTQSLADNDRSGFLLELNYILAGHVRLGAGYNFTDFTDNELGDFSRDESGAFVRVTGMY